VQLAVAQEQVRRSNPGLSRPPSVMGMPVEPPPDEPAPAEVAPVEAAAPAPEPAAEPEPAPAPPPAQKPAAVPTPVRTPARPPAQVVTPVRSRPSASRPAPRSVEPPPPQRNRWVLPALLAASLAFGISGVLFGLTRRNEPAPVPKEPVSMPVVAAAPAPAPAPPPAPVAAAAPVQAPPSAAPASAVGKSPPPPPVVASGHSSLASTLPSAPASNEPGEVFLKVDPPVDVFMDGERLGRTPLSAPAPNGKHTFKLTNGELGISVTRALSVAGKTKQEWSIGKGSVMVSAPEGATIILDGKTIGKAPVKEIPAYEGQHRILVTLGKAKYTQPFLLHPTETMYVTVELAPQE